MNILKHVRGELLYIIYSWVLHSYVDNTTIVYNVPCGPERHLHCNDLPYWLSRNDVENLPISVGEQGTNFFIASARKTNSLSSILKTKFIHYVWIESKAPHIYMDNKCFQSHRCHSQRDVKYIALLEIHNGSLKLVGQLLLYTFLWSEHCGLGSCVFLKVTLLTNCWQHQCMNSEFLYHLAWCLVKTKSSTKYMLNTFAIESLALTWSALSIAHTTVLQWLCTWKLFNGVLWKTSFRRAFDFRFC